MTLPETVDIDPPRPADGAVIWLHGLGADGHDFEPVVPQLRLDGVLALRFVFPHAPVREVTINNGIAMRAWYDVMSLDRSGPQDESGIRDSMAALEALVEREIGRGIDRDRIVLAGFSQGGAVAMRTALSIREPFAGLMVLSSWMPLGESFARDVADNSDAQPRSLPIFMAHGVFDPMLPLALGKESRSALEGAGYRVEWHEYPMAHGVCAEEIEHIRRWLLKVYGADDGAATGSR